MRDPEIVASSYYHVYNRGVDKRRIFEDHKDFSRFIESLYLFNDENHAHAGGDPIWRMTALSSHEALESVRKPLVSIVSYVLMPNHFHLLLKQKASGGISKFLQRLGIGHAKYFNLRHERTGRLFESTFKAKPVDFEEHLLHMPRYIHLNALDGTDLDWRTGKIENWLEVERLLEAYPWSSHHVYQGRVEELPIVDLAEVENVLSSFGSYSTYLRDWAGRSLLPEEIEE